MPMRVCRVKPEQVRRFTAAAWACGWRFERTLVSLPQTKTQNPEISAPKAVCDVVGLLRHEVNDHAPLGALFLFIHTQKHTQKYLLDFKSSESRHDRWLLALHGPVALRRPCFFPATPHPLSISAKRHPSYPNPPKFIWVPPATFTPCSARTISKKLKFV
jgi:hypothetical protein